MAQYQQMKAQEIRSVVTSGNQYYQSISSFPEIVNGIAFTVENGNWIVSEGKDIFNGELLKDAFTAVVEHLLTCPEVEIVARGKSSVYTLKKYDNTMEAVMEMCYHCLEHVDSPDNLEDIFSESGLNLSDELVPQVQKVLYGIIGDTMVSVHTGSGNINLIIPDAHKADGLRQLQKLWGVDDSEVVVSSDDGNNIEMLCQIGSSLAMENTDSAVVATVKYCTGFNNCEGVLDVIDKVLKHEAPSG